MKDFNIRIKSGSGKHNNLDKEYNNYVLNIINNSDNQTKERWHIYSIIMDELVKINEIECFEEVKYRLTDGENPNYIMLDIINKNKNNSELLWFIKKRIDEYIDDDFYKLFFN